jgi:hypothetical protein
VCAKRRVGGRSGFWSVDALWYGYLGRRGGGALAERLEVDCVSLVCLYAGLCGHTASCTSIVSGDPISAYPICVSYIRVLSGHIKVSRISIEVGVRRGKDLGVPAACHDEIELRDVWHSGQGGAGHDIVWNCMDVFC